MAKFKPFTKKTTRKKPGSKADTKKDTGKFGDWTPPWVKKGKKGKK